MFADCFLIVKAGDSVILTTRTESGEERSLTISRTGSVIVETTGGTSGSHFMSMPRTQADRLLSVFAAFLR